MSKDQSKKETKLTQQPAPVTKEKQQIKPTTELTDADLEKVSGGKGQTEKLPLRRDTTVFISY